MEMQSTLTAMVTFSDLAEMSVGLNFLMSETNRLVTFADK